jgi:hypothetical protein
MNHFLPQIPLPDREYLHEQEYDIHPDWHSYIFPTHDRVWFLQQSFADSPDHASQNLTFCCFRIDNFPCCNGCNRSFYSIIPNSSSTSTSTKTAL